MLLVDGQIFDIRRPQEYQNHPQWEFVSEKFEELKRLYKKNTDESGNQKIVIKNVRGIRRNKITGYLEPPAQVSIPLTTTIQDREGYTATWKYTKSAPTRDSFGEMRFSDTNFIFGDSLVLDKSQIDYAFYLIYIVPEIGFKRGEGVFGVVVDDAKEARGIVQEEEGKAAIKYWIYDAYSPLTDPELLFKISTAWNAEKVEFNKKMHDMFVADSDKATAKDFADKCRVNLEKAVWLGVQNGIGIEKFIQAVQKDPEWVDLKVDIMNAIKNKFIDIDRGTGKAYFEIGGEKTTICSIAPAKRAGLNYVQDVMNVLSNDDDLMEILESLGDVDILASTTQKFNPKEYEPTMDSLNEMKYPKLRSLATLLKIKVDKGTKEPELRTMVIDKYKEVGLL